MGTDCGDVSDCLHRPEHNRILEHLHSFATQPTTGDRSVCCRRRRATSRARQWASIFSSSTRIAASPSIENAPPEMTRTMDTKSAPIRIVPRLQHSRSTRPPGRASRPAGSVRGNHPATITRQERTTSLRPRQARSSKKRPSNVRFGETSRDPGTRSHTRLDRLTRSGVARSDRSRFCNAGCHEIPESRLTTNLSSSGAPVSYEVPDSYHTPQANLAGCPAR